MGVLEAPRKLERHDDRSTFSCGQEELDTWLRQYAWQNQKANNAVVYVTLQDGVVLGYYAIASAAYARQDAPEPLRRGSRPSEIPCILLARLAVDRRAQGQGVGAGLLRDALERAAQLSEAVGAAALVIHCLNDEAREFYLANGDFVPSPADEYHLLLPMKTIIAQVTALAQQL